MLQNCKMSLTVCLVLLLSFVEGCVTPPKITSTPNKVAVAGAEYKYEAHADGSQPITFALVEGPDGFVVSRTGTSTWTPSKEGESNVTIAAENKANKPDKQTFTIRTVVPPKIVSAAPAPLVHVDEAFRYDIQVTGTKPVKYVMKTGPSGFSLEQGGGALWKPNAEGESKVQITVSNDWGEDSQEFLLRAGVAPKITSIPAGTGVVGQEYRYDVKTRGTLPITYKLTGGPAQFRLDGNGVAVWTPTVIGNHKVLIDVRNDWGEDSQSFVVKVAEAKEFGAGMRWGDRLWREKYADLAFIEELAQNRPLRENPQFRAGLLKGFADSATSETSSEKAKNDVELLIEAASLKSTFEGGALTGEKLRKNALTVEAAAAAKRQSIGVGPASELAWKAGFVAAYAGNDVPREAAVRVYLALTI